MPARVEITPQTFAEFEAELLKRKFERVSRGRIARDFKQFGLRPPRRRSKGHQAGYIAEKNGLTVYVWTTYSPEEEKMQESNEGWVLLTEKGRRRWCSYPHHRTKNFLKTMLMLARISRWRAAHRPRCKECGAYMRVRFGKTFKSRYWECVGTLDEPHRRITNSWAHDMPPEAVEFEQQYAQTHRQTPGPALKSRDKWKATVSS